VRDFDGHLAGLAWAALFGPSFVSCWPRLEFGLGIRMYQSA